MLYIEAPNHLKAWSRQTYKKANWQKKKDLARQMVPIDKIIRDVEDCEAK